MKDDKFYQIRQSSGDPLNREQPGYYVDVVKVVHERDWMAGPFKTEKEAREAAAEVLNGHNSMAKRLGKPTTSVKRASVRGTLNDLRAKNK
jgi:hypothetical protein